MVFLLGNKKERPKIRSWNGRTLCKSLRGTVEVHSLSLQVLVQKGLTTQSREAS